MSNIRIGVLGLGSMGRHHVRNARETEGFELVGVADPLGDRFAVAGDLEVLPSVEALMEVGIDAAIVATSTAFHADAVLKLAESGIHTLVEKPLASTLEEGEKIVSAFENADAIGAVGYVERCNPALLEMRRRIANGFLGEIYQVATRRQSPFPARIADVGVVKDLATHDVDLAAWVSDSDYDLIFAQTGYRSGREFEDTLTASGRLTNGALVSHIVNWLTPYKDRTIVVTGERGALVADTTMSDLTFYENGRFPLEWDQIAAFRGVSEGEVRRFALVKREPLRVEHEHFRDAILGTGTEHVTLREGLRTMKVVQAILDSASSGQAITL